MSLVKTYPTPVTRVRDQFDRMFDRMFNRDFPFVDVDSGMNWSPSLDLSETETEFKATVEVPGMPRENLDVSVDQNVLTISGHREAVVDEETDQFIWKEREFGRFMRSVRLPKAVKEDKIAATVNNGVLHIVLPKREPAGKSKIVIK